MSAEADWAKESCFVFVGLNTRSQLCSVASFGSSFAAARFAIFLLEVVPYNKCGAIL